MSVWKPDVISANRDSRAATAWMMQRAILDQTPARARQVEVTPSRSPEPARPHLP